MPTDKDFKRLVRARMGKTGESYTTARSQLRPDPGPDRPGPLRGRHPDTAALTRLLAALGVTDPATGRPLDEATVLGVSGGIGFAYFVFEYEEGATLYLGGRINSYVQKTDATEAALTRLGVPFQARRTSGPATAERQLRAALDQGRPVLATVDVARLRYRAVPDWLCGMTPQDVLVELADGQPLLWDLAPAPFPVTWAELAEARAGVRSARHRLVVAEPPERPVDLAGAAAAGIADTWAGMLEPPMRNFGVPGLVKWAELLTAPRAPKGWPRLLDPPGRQFQLLTWLYDWVETAGTGGGFFRAMYAEFLKAAAGPLGRPELAGLAADLRELAAAWTALAGAVAAAAGGDGPLARAAALLERRRRLVEEQGAAAAAEVAAVQAELAALADATADPQPLDPAALAGLLAGLRDRVLALAEAEEAAAAALRGAVPAPG
jgi:hypothetical protein